MPNRLPCRCTPVATLALSLALFLAACASPDRHSPGHQPIRVTIVHTNDSHSRLSPFPDSTLLSATTVGPQQGGVARRKALIDEIRAGEANLLLFDAGDNFQGTIFYNAWRGSAEVMALNALDYDAITLGNHEFDLGPAELGRALRGVDLIVSGHDHTLLGEPAASYRLATNSFLAGGGDGYSMLATACADGSSCRDTGILELDLLVGEFTAASPVVRTTGQRLVAH